MFIILNDFWNKDSEWKLFKDIDNEIQKADVAEKALLYIFHGTIESIL
ncbi:MAG: hypothetical protein R2760_06410 [Chitinophagales bacterium]